MTMQISIHRYNSIMSIIIFRSDLHTRVRLVTFFKSFYISKIFIQTYVHWDADG